MADDQPAPNTHLAVIRESTMLDLKTVLLIAGGVLSVATSWGQVQLSMARMDAEHRAEIVRVENTADKRIGALEARLIQIQSTNCAIARSLKVMTSECGRFEP